MPPGNARRILCGFEGGENGKGFLQINIVRGKEKGDSDQVQKLFFAKVFPQVKKSFRKGKKVFP